MNKEEMILIDKILADPTASEFVKMQARAVRDMHNGLSKPMHDSDGKFIKEEE